MPVDLPKAARTALVRRGRPGVVQAPRRTAASVSATPGAAPAPAFE
ncbi:hypothetical protein [Micromonospora pisi]|nr:hypothetical protein [Micromonospora pisi]